jgi:hypothetical protein
VNISFILLRRSLQLLKITVFVLSFGFFGQGSPCNDMREIQILRVVNCIPITNLDLSIQQRITSYLLNVLKIEGVKEKLGCNLEEMDLESFALSSLLEQSVLDSYTLKLAQNLPQCVASPAEIKSIISRVAQGQKMSENALNQSLQQASLTIKHLEDFFAHTIKVQKVLYHLLYEESARITEDEAFRIVSMSEGFSDLKIRYILLSQPANQKGFEELIKMRVDLQRGKNLPNQEIKNVFITEIQDKDVASLLMQLDTGTTSHIWRCQDKWNMVYLKSRKMITPNLNSLNAYAQINSYVKLKGNAYKLFTQLKYLSFVRDPSHEAN